MSERRIADQLADYFRTHFDLAALKDRQDYGYPTLPPCVIAAVFGVGSRFGSGHTIARRYMNHYPPDGESLAGFLEAYRIRGSDGMMQDVYQNRTMSSAARGVTKAEAVLRFAEALHAQQATTPQQALSLQGKAQFEGRIRQIPGQGTSMALTFFYMLAGNRNLVRLDAKITRLVTKVTGYAMYPKLAQHNVLTAVRRLQADYPELTARALDEAIWQHTFD